MQKNRKLLTLIKVKDPLRRWNDRDIVPIEYNGQNLLELRNQHFSKDISVVVSINGKIIPDNKLSMTHPVEGDHILFIPEIGGGDDGKSILGAILMIAIAVVAPYASAFLLGSTVAKMGLTGYLVAAGITMVGGLMVNTFVMPTPDIPGINSDGIERSQTYSWQPQTVQEQGIAIPVFYGLNKLYGNVISSFTESVKDDDKEKNILNILLSMGLGPYKRFFNFMINDQLKDDNNMPFNIEERRGLINQEPMNMFNKTKIERSVSVKVEHGTSYIYTTPGNNFKLLEIDIKFPQGLWFINSQGNFSTLRLYLRVKIRKQGDTNWILLTHDTASVAISAWGYWSLGRKYLDRTVDSHDDSKRYKWVEFERGSHNPNDHNEGDYFYSYDHGMAYWRWIGAPITTVNAQVNYTVVYGDKTSPITKTFIANIDPNNKGNYEIYVEYIKAEVWHDGKPVDQHAYRAWEEIDYTSTKYGHDTYLYIVREVDDDPFEYPRLATLGISAIATEKISGSFRFSCMAECRYINVYDGTKWDNVMSDNPAWIVWDILTQPVFYDSSVGKSNININIGGGDIVRYDGIHPDNLDLNKFKEWADYCDDHVKTILLSGTVSTNSDSNGIKVIGSNTFFTSEIAEGDYIGNENIGIRKVTQIESDTVLYLAYPFDSYLSGEKINNVEKRCTFNGGFDIAKLSLFDAAQKVAEIGRAVIVLNGNMYTVAIDKPITTPVQMFNVGNMKIDSFKEVFLPMEDRASEIEIDFINAQNGFVKERLNVFNDSMTTRNNKMSIQGFGIQKPSEAWRYAMFKLYKNQYLQRVVEFNASVDAIVTTIGDGCYIQHDVPQWSYGGRIVSATINTVTLDREVTIESGNTYSIMIVLSDDTRVEKTVINSAGTYTTLNLSTPFDTTPQKYNPYLFGKQGEAKIFRVIDISRSQDLERTITAIEYNASIYNVDTDEPAIPTKNVSLLNSFPPVTELVADELIIRGDDGSINDLIDIYFKKPTDPIYASADIWYNSKGGNWKYAGNTSNDHFRINNVKTGVTYTIAVVTVNIAGQKDNIENAPTVSIYTRGKYDPPSDVTGFTATQNEQFINFNWDHIPDVDLWGYEIRKGTVWESSHPIGKIISQNSFMWQAELNGTYRFLIKAIDTSGLYSNNPTSVDITLKGINESINVILYQEEINNPNGTKTNFANVSEIPALMIPFGVLDTDVPNRTDTDSEFTNYKGDLNTYAEYITSTIDTYKVGKTAVRITTNIDAYDNNATDQSYPDRVDTTYPSDTDQHITMPTENNLYLSFSNDNVSWSSWYEYHGTLQEEFRYCKVKFTTDISSQTGVFKLKSLYMSFDTPDVNFTIENFLISTSGNDIVFADLNPPQQFYNSFTVRATLLNDSSNKVPVVNKNNGLLGFNIYLLDTANNKVSGTVDIHVTGY